ncbi:2'-5' RNA ligase family protein [Xanthomonas maliensis]|uniref:2'-5' RNA ligase family protein n=2 Tax=Xanthomonas maliensis TaxID=1321368 RepID=UPI003CCD41A8
MSNAPNSRRQLTLFVQEPGKSRLDALRSSLDPVQASLISAHVTLCREDEIEKLDPAAVFSKVESWAQGALRLAFGVPRAFNGHGVLLPCVHGSDEFHRLRQWLLEDQGTREHAAHLTLAHPRNPKAQGNTAIALAGLPSALEFPFPVVSLIEQHGSAPWRVLQEANLGGTAHGVA